MMFAVVCTESPDVYIESFNTGAFAADFARILTTSERDKQNPRKFRVVQIANNNKEDFPQWKIREAGKFVTGTYKKLPWHSEPWNSFDHFAHVSQDDHSKVALTPNDTFGEQDRQIRMRPGRYLQMHFGAVLSQDQIREWCAKFTAENKENPVKFATTPDEIEWVYTHGPDSCMSHDANRYGSSEHPTRVYGAGDLAIAYIERDERITARAICWPERKIYGRIYGDENLFAELLIESGYRCGSTSSDWNGAKLLRTEEKGAFVAPYFDYPNQYVRDDGKHLVIDGTSDIECRNTSGLTDDDRNTCYNCEERCDETYTVDGQEWCESCYENHSWRCEDCEDSFSGSPYITSNDGCSICEYCARHYRECAHCEEYFPRDDLEYSEVMEKHYCERCVERHMTRTHCGDLADTEDDCECDECETARNQENNEDETEIPEAAD